MQQAAGSGHDCTQCCIRQTQSEAVCSCSPCRTVFSSHTSPYTYSTLVSSQIHSHQLITNLVLCWEAELMGYHVSCSCATLLTLLTLHGSIVACFPERDVPQVQYSGHDLQHHGPAIRRYAHHTHGMLGKQREKSGWSCRSVRVYTLRRGFTTCNNLCCGTAVKQKQLEKKTNAGGGQAHEHG